MDLGGGGVQSDGFQPRQTVVVADFSHCVPPWETHACISHGGVQ